MNVGLLKTLLWLAFWAILAAWTAHIAISDSLDDFQTVQDLPLLMVTLSSLVSLGVGMRCVLYLERVHPKQLAV